MTIGWGARNEWIFLTELFKPDSKMNLLHLPGFIGRYNHNLSKHFVDQRLRVKIENILRKDSKGKKWLLIIQKQKCILLSAIGILIKLKNIFQL